jgi:hypothetical protein
LEDMCLVPCFAVYLCTVKILHAMRPVVYKVTARDKDRNGVLNRTRGARRCAEVEF